MVESVICKFPNSDVSNSHHYGSMQNTVYRILTRNRHITKDEGRNRWRLELSKFFYFRSMNEIVF